MAPGGSGESGMVPRARNVHDGNVRRSFSQKNPRRQLACVNFLFHGVRIRSANRSMTQTPIDEAISREPLSDGGDNFTGPHHGLGLLLRYRLEENNGMGRKRRDLL